MVGVVVFVTMAVIAVVMRVVAVVFVLFMAWGRLLISHQRRVVCIAMHAVRLGVGVLGGGVHSNIIVPQPDRSPQGQPTHPQHHAARSNRASRGIAFFQCMRAEQRCEQDRQLARGGDVADGREYHCREHQNIG